MKIIEWFKNILTKIRKEDYMLKENNETNVNHDGESFVAKVNIEKTNTREEIFRSLKETIIQQAVSEEYTSNEFTDEKIKEEYDKDSILADEDITALKCIYSGIKDGNLDEGNPENNKISEFLKEKPNNIAVLINLMIKDAQIMYNSLDKEMAEKTQVKELIVGSYSSISNIIDKYNRDKDLFIEEK